MASSRLCTTCNKPSASIHCIGCDGYFCNKCFRLHRQSMIGRMDDIIESRNQLQQDINNSAQLNNQQSPIITEINKWESSTIEKVKKVAAEARQQTVQLLNASRIKIDNEFKSFSRELATLQESEDYIEHDLERLNQKINEFKLAIKQSTQPTTIQLHTEQADQINWGTLIYVEEIRLSATKNNQQTPRKSYSQMTYFSNMHKFVGHVIAKYHTIL